MTSLPKNILTHANNSKRRKNTLSSIALSASQKKFSQNNNSHGLAAIVDYTKNIFYAPITNINEKDLIDALNIDGKDEKEERNLIDFIRDNFPFEASSSALFRNILQLSRRERYKEYANDLWFVELKKDGQPRKIITTITQKNKSAVICRESFAINTDVSFLIESIQRKVDKEKKLKSFIVIQPTAKGILGNESFTNFVPLGFYFLDNKITARTLIEEMFEMSKLIAYHILFERERYYERSLRQCINGSIIKCGLTSEIQNQVANLKTLVDRKNGLIPIVLDEDPDLAKFDLKNNDSHGLSWYSMPRFSLISLHDLLTSVESLNDYEVYGILSGIFSHLKEFYWGTIASTLGDVPVDIDSALILPTIFARDRSEALRVNLYSNIQQIKPIKLEDRHLGFISDFAALRIKDIGRLLQAESEQGGKYTIKVKIHSQSGMNECRAIHPTPFLDSLLEKLQSLSSIPRVALHKSRADEIHGDSHFANLLIDASIPEAPVIVTIDPLKVSFNSFLRKIIDKEYLFNVKIEEKEHLNQKELSESLQKEFKDNGILLTQTLPPKVVKEDEEWEITDKAEKWIIKKDGHKLNIYKKNYSDLRKKDYIINHIVPEINHTRNYDYAKLALSAVLMYSIVYKGGIKYTYDRKEHIVELLTDDVRVSPMGDFQGGISSASLFKIAPTVSKDSLRYHRLARNALIQEIINLDTNDTADFNTTISNLLTVWLIMIRHALSLCSKCYFKNPEITLGLYATTSLTIGSADQVISDIFEAIEENDWSEAKILKFSSALFSNPLLDSRYDT